jgi:hypothetical protein
MNPASKRIVFSCGGKGGVGKTTVASAVADYYAARGIAATLFDCDTENKQRGSLRHFFPAAEKLDIRAERGLDRFVDIALAADTPVALADLAAGSGRDTFHWFDTMFDGLAAAGVGFTAVATITSAASSVETLFTWANALGTRARYLVVKNHLAGDDFGYFEDTEPGRAFLAQAEPIVIDLKARAREIQTELDNRGLTAAQVSSADAARRGPLLNGGTGPRPRRGLRAPNRRRPRFGPSVAPPVTAPNRFPDSVYDRIASYLPTDQREMFFRYVANLRALDAGDPLIMLAEGMAVFTCVGRQVPEALGMEREKLLAEFTRLCTRHETATTNATADVRTLFAAHQKLLEQNIAAWQTKEQQTAQALDRTAKRLEETANHCIARLQAECGELHTATKEHQAAATTAQSWVARVSLESRAWPYLACTACGAIFAQAATHLIKSS